MRLPKSIHAPLFLIILLASCSSDEEYDLPNRIDARAFTLNTPAGWALRQDQGIDTYVGRIGGPKGDTIYFDQGYLSFGSLDNIKQDDQTLYFRRLTVNGIPAIVEKETRTNDTGAVRMSIYLDAGDQQQLNVLSMLSPRNEPLILQIFRTHRFQ